MGQVVVLPMLAKGPPAVRECFDEYPSLKDFFIYWFSMFDSSLKGPKHDQIVC